jgi:hypothetical protein
VLLALLPVPNKLSHLSAKTDRQIRECNADVLHKALATILQPLNAAGKEGIDLECADKCKRRCYPVLAAWIADYMEYAKLLHLKKQACPVCTVEDHQLGADFRPSYPMRQYNEYYRRYVLLHGLGSGSNMEKNEASTYFVNQRVKPYFNVFWRLQRVQPERLHTPDLLHGIYLGLLKHLMDWLEPFLKKYDRLGEFDAVWKNLPHYPGFNRPRRAYREVSQWQGKELRALGRAILAALAASLGTPLIIQQQPFHQALQCVRNLVDFHLMAQYRSHTPETLHYMDTYLNKFHQTKNVFLEFRVSKRAAEHVKDSVKQLREQHIQAATSTQHLTAAKRRRIEAENRGEEIDLRESIIHEESHFNFIKMHLPWHYREHVERLGSIQAYSTEVSETAHRTQVKDGYRASNRQKYHWQIIKHQSRIAAFGMRQLNVSQLAREGFYSAEVPDVMDLLSTAGISPSEIISLFTDTSRSTSQEQS